MAVFFLLSIISTGKAVGFDNYVTFFWPYGSTNYFYDVTSEANMAAVSANGYILDSKVCSGGTFKLSFSNSTGEFDSKGGYSDTPPIVFVDDLDAVMNKILQVNPNAKSAYRNKIIKNFGNPDVYIDPDTGIPVYFNYQCNWGGPKAKPQCGMTWYSTIVCQATSQNANVEGATMLTNGLYQVTSTDSVTLDVKSDVNCFFYAYGWLSSDKNTLTLMQSIFMPGNGGCNYCPKTVKVKGMTIGSFQLKQTFQVDNSPPPTLSVSAKITNEQVPPGSSTYARVVISNGGSEVNIKGISFNTKSKLISCTSTKLSPDSSTECIVSLSPTETTDLQATVSYQYNQCGERQTAMQKAYIGTLLVSQPECYSDSDCKSGYLCCDSICHDSTKGVCRDIEGTGISTWIPTS